MQCHTAHLSREEPNSRLLSLVPLVRASWETEKHIFFTLRKITATGIRLCFSLSPKTFELSSNDLRFLLISPTISVPRESVRNLRLNSPLPLSVSYSNESQTPVISTCQICVLPPHFLPAAPLLNVCLSHFSDPNSSHPFFLSLYLFIGQIALSQHQANFLKWPSPPLGCYLNIPFKLRNPWLLTQDLCD